MRVPVETIRNLGSELEAHLVCSKLEQHGLHPAVGKVSRYKAMAGAGFVVRVPKTEANQARAILDPLERPINLDEYVDSDDESYIRCPACRSVNVTVRPLTPKEKQRVFLSLGLALLFLRRERGCTKCGHEWKE